MTDEEVKKLSADISIPIKQLNRLNKEKWYHGTTEDAYLSMLEQGVRADYNYGSQLDFGMGFYLTDSLNSASNYISRVPVLDDTATSFMERKEWCVVEFEFNPFKLLFESENSYTYHNFAKHDDDFAKFVFENRLYNVYNEHPHGYDIIWGVMSDSVPPEVLLSYLNKQITYDEAIEKLQKPQSMKQLFIGTQSICDMLRISNVEYFKKED